MNMLEDIKAYSTHRIEISAKIAFGAHLTNKRGSFEFAHLHHDSLDSGEIECAPLLHGGAQILQIT